MRVALFADGEVGLDVATYLLSEYPSDVELVVTVGDNAIAELSREAGKSTMMWREFRAASKKDPTPFATVEMGVLAWWPFIVREPQIGLFPKGYLNFHPSFLPYNRGKHYNFWALVEQCPFGVTLHKIDIGIDTGPIVAQDRIEYDWTDTGGSLHEKAQRGIVTLFRATYPKLRDDELPDVPQPTDECSFHHSSELEPASRIQLDDEYRARDLLNLLRARTFPGFPGCTFEVDGRTYEIGITIREVGE